MESIINIYTKGVVSYTGSRLFIKTSGQLVKHKCPRTLMLYVCDACLKDNCHTCITQFNDNVGSMHLYIWDFPPLKGKLCLLFPQTWTVMWLVFDWAVLSASVKWISIHVIKLLNVNRVFYRAESVSMRIESTINAENQLLRDQLSRERGLRKQIEADKHELQSQLLESKDRLHHLNSSLKQKDSLMKKLDQVWL